MERLPVVQARLAGIGQLREVVAAMRSLAGLRLQQAQAMLGGARRYADTVTAALAQALLLAGDAAPTTRQDDPPALLLFTAEHGFVGGYTDALTRAALDSGAAPLLVVGSRGARALAEAGRPPDWSLPAASHAGGVAALARRLAAELGTRLMAGGLSRLDLMFAAVAEGGGWAVRRRSLLPPDSVRPPAGRLPPLHTLPAAELLTRMVGEHLLAALAAAAAEALAAENAARLQAMVAAHDNIERKLATLRQQEQILRQEQITEELLDVIGGAMGAL